MKYEGKYYDESNLKYEKHYYVSGVTKEVTYEEALDTLLGIYNDNDMTRAMLKIPNAILCNFYGLEILVTDENGERSPEGLFNLLPDEFIYV